MARVQVPTLNPNEYLEAERKAERLRARRFPDLRIAPVFDQKAIAIELRTQAIVTDDELRREYESA